MPSTQAKPAAAGLGIWQVTVESMINEREKEDFLSIRKKKQRLFWFESKFFSLDVGLKQAYHSSE